MEYLSSFQLSFLSFVRLGFQHKPLYFQSFLGFMGVRFFMLIQARASFRHKNEFLF